MHWLRSCADAATFMSYEALHDPEIQKRLADLSAEAVGGSPRDTTKYFAEETERWKNVITSAHVTLD